MKAENQSKSMNMKRTIVKIVAALQIGIGVCCWSAQLLCR